MKHIKRAKYKHCTSYTRDGKVNHRNLLVRQPHSVYPKGKNRRRSEVITYVRLGTPFIPSCQWGILQSCQPRKKCGYRLGQEHYWALPGENHLPLKLPFPCLTFLCYRSYFTWSLLVFPIAPAAQLRSLSWTELSYARSWAKLSGSRAWVELSGQLKQLKKAFLVVMYYILKG